MTPCTACDGTGLETTHYRAYNGETIRTIRNENKPCPACHGTGTQE